MTITAAIVRELIAAGLSGDELVSALERIEAASAPQRTARQERNRRYYEAHKDQIRTKASERRLNSDDSDAWRLIQTVSDAPLPSSPDGPLPLPHTPTLTPLNPPPTNTSPGDAPGLPAPRKKSKAALGKPDYHGDFEMLWVEFPRSPNSSKAEAYRSWLKLSDEDREHCFDGALAYAEWLAKQARPPPPCHLATFINQRRFDTLLEAAE